MTDAQLASSLAATPVTTWLAGQRPGLETVACHGALTPLQLDVRTAEIEAVVSAAALHDLGWMRRVQVRGEDRFRWLSGMVTNTVKDIPANGGAWNLVLNAQGRIQGDLTVWREPAHPRIPNDPAEPSDEDALELEIAADQYDRLTAHLDHFIIMDDVELLPDPAADVAIGLTGPLAGALLAKLGITALPEPMTQARLNWNGSSLLLRRNYGAFAAHYELWASSPAALQLWTALQAAGAHPVGAAALEALRVAEAVPAYGVDIVERDLPQETSQTRALHFTKGCYLGQEIVERIRSRGNVHRHLRALQLDGPLPAPGTQLTLDGAPAGHITSAAELPLAAGTRRLALGIIRAEAETRNLPLEYSTAETTARALLLSGPPSF